MDPHSTPAPVGLNKPGTNAFSLQHLQVPRQGGVTLHPAENDRWRAPAGASRAHVARRLPLYVTCALSACEGMRAAGVNALARTHTQKLGGFVSSCKPIHPVLAVTTRIPNRFHLRGRSELQMVIVIWLTIRG